MKKNTHFTVMKFGGSILKSAENIIKSADIIVENKPIIVVVSAIAKTTSNLEKIVYKFVNRQNFDGILKQIYDDHIRIIKQIDKQNRLETFFNDLFKQLLTHLKKAPKTYQKEYAAIVSYGEIFSSKLISEFLNIQGVDNQWIDIRKGLKTYPQNIVADIIWDLSKQLTTKLFNSEANIYITQGFIAEDINGKPTTLGREGSDYTASILANFFNAKELIFWKDATAIFNVDPNYTDFNPVKIPKLSYDEVVELAQLGAKILHPKTIPPLKQKKIKVHIKSINTPTEIGTSIYDFKRKDNFNFPFFVIEQDNLLVVIKMPLVNVKSVFKLWKFFSKFSLKPKFFEFSSQKIFFLINHNEGWKNFILSLKHFINNSEKNIKIFYLEGVKMLTVYKPNAKTPEQVKNFTKYLKKFPSDRLLYYKFMPQKAFFLLKTK